MEVKVKELLNLCANTNISIISFNTEKGNSVFYDIEDEKEYNNFLPMVVKNFKIFGENFIITLKNEEKIK